VDQLIKAADTNGDGKASGCPSGILKLDTFLCSPQPLPEDVADNDAGTLTGADAPVLWHAD
jgi:hypothetical protein